MQVSFPKLDDRSFQEILAKLRSIAPFYVPEWSTLNEKDAGHALLRLYAHILESVMTRFNQVPHKNFVAFLDMLGIQLLPAQAAKVPLTFQLAKGTQKEILVPARTRAAADKTDVHDEQSFETINNLLAIPSLLTRVFSVDPQADAIFQPPPGFLTAGTTPATSLNYKIVAAVSAGATILQLDHVTDLKEGDFLKITGQFLTEYPIISTISGNIVTIADKLLSDYPVQTAVEKVVTFNLFEGHNFQEHGLYLGHRDLFNVKSLAQFNLHTTLLAGTTADTTNLKLAWEYWGEKAGQEGEAWFPFNVIDYTQNFSQSGETELHKMTAGEIKEKEINGIKSRWIRGRLNDPLPVDQSYQLPQLEQVQLVVKSAGTGLAPEQAFNNDVPLDVSQPYAPFGEEPRMFERFALANKEAFSKKGAKVKLDVEVEKRGILGPPTAILDGNLIRVFARGTGGRLIELKIDSNGNGDSVWEDHGYPPNTKMAANTKPDAIIKPTAVPVVLAAVSQNAMKYISVFLIAENGHLIERFFNGIQWQWIDHKIPESGEKSKFNFATIYDPSVTLTSKQDAFSVFVTGSNGNLLEFHRKYITLTGTWINHGKESNKKSLDSAPFACRYSDKAIVFFKDAEGELCGLDCKLGITSEDAWKNYGFPEKDLIKVDSKPLAAVTKDDGKQLRAYVTGSDNVLWKFDKTDSTESWISTGLSSVSSPHGYIFEPGGTSCEIHIFVLGMDGSLLELSEIPNSITTNDHKFPPNITLNFCPFVLRISNASYHVFVSSEQASITEKETSNNIWNEYKDPYETALTPALSWEYWNKKGWVVLKNLIDGTANLLNSGKIAFNLPKDIEKTEIAGQEDYWIRARLVGGDYGKETFSFTAPLAANRTGILNQEISSTKKMIRPPMITRLTISYAFEQRQFPEKCLTHNNLEYLDQTAACQVPGKHYQPFVKLTEKNKSLFLGFNKLFQGGPIKIFFAAKELPFIEAKKPKMEWQHTAKTDWGELSHYDATEALILREILDFIAPPGFVANSLFGNYLYWVKGSLIKGSYQTNPVLSGIYPNTTWAIQAETVKNEIIGSGNGLANQTFTLLKPPVLEGEEIRIKETLSDEEKQQLQTDGGENAVYEKKDRQGNLLETWILWTQVPDFYDSTPFSRHYTLDRATGQLRFGDGTKGLIPPSGENNIKAFSYQTGGGSGGNVDAGEVKTLKTAVAGVDKVFNPIAADGGAETATVEQMLEIGPARLSHRNRAVTAEDFEWLAKQASRKIAKVRCLPNTNNLMQPERGWVTVIIVPDSAEDQPMPSLELRRKVTKHLENHCAAPLTDAGHVNVTPPVYQTIGIEADVFVTSIDVATIAEREVKTQLKAFFHPLTGGPEKNGWEFGRAVSASDVFALLEAIDGVDHIENLKFTFNGTVSGAVDLVPVPPHALVANGSHAINLKLVDGE